MGRPKKAPEDVLETVGSRIPRTLSRKIQDAMSDLHAKRKIERATVSAAVGWLIARGVDAYEQDSDQTLSELLKCWPELTESEREIVKGMAELMINQKKAAASPPGIHPADTETPQSAGPAMPLKKPRKGDGSRGNEDKEREERRLKIAK